MGRVAIDMETSERFGSVLLLVAAYKQYQVIHRDIDGCRTKAVHCGPL
jgi:hypothetical protein